jgi:hypothetical protein
MNTKMSDWRASMSLAYNSLPNLMFPFTKNNTVTFLSLLVNFVLLPIATFIILALSGVLIPTSVDAGLFTFVQILGLTLIFATLLGFVPKKNINETTRAYLFFFLVTATPFVAWFVFVKYFLVN